jgi:hypothetical protein
VPGFAEVTSSHGFTNRELEMMFSDNPARALGLPVTQRTVSEVAAVSSFHRSAFFVPFGVRLSKDRARSTR